MATAKDEIRKLLDRLPDDASLEDIQYHIYVREKVDKAQKYFEDIVWAQVVLLIEKSTHKAEIVIHARRQTFRALAAAADLYSAVDLASDKIDSQLKKYKEKLKDHHKVPAEDAEAPPRPEALTVAVIPQPVFPMSAEEAVEDMEARGHSFLLYQDRASGNVQVVFRRTDESYAVLSPVKKTKR